MKLNQSATPATDVFGTARILQFCLVLSVGLFLSGCQHRAEVAHDHDPTGVYALVTVNGLKLPATVSHGDAVMQVRSGVFTINADGTCRSKVTFVPPSGSEFTREVKATYTRRGAELSMQWEGAGKTEGTVEGDTFTMDNEGMIFAYEK